MTTKILKLKSDTTSVPSLEDYVSLNRFIKFTTSKDMYVSSMRAEDWMKYQTIPINRAVEHRVNKVDWQQAIDKQTPSVMKISQVYVTQDLSVQIGAGDQIETVIVPKGIYTLDGNTRKHYYTIHPDKTPTCNFLIELYTASSEKELMDLYFSFDNNGAVETNAHKLSGVFRFFNLKFKSPRLQKGGIITALNAAYPDKDEKDMFVKVAYFKDALQLMDKLNVFDPAHKTLTNCQTFWASCLMIAKQYEDTVYMQQVADAFTRFGRTDKKQIGAQVADGYANGFDGVTAVWNLFMNFNGDPKNVKVWTMPNKETFEGTLKSTKWASIPPQMDIQLDFLNRYVTGVKPIVYQPNCEGTYNSISKDLMEGMYS